MTERSYYNQIMLALDLKEKTLGHHTEEVEDEKLRNEKTLNVLKSR